MVHARYTVKPKHPTVLYGEDIVKLPGFELWMNYIENVLVIPTRLELACFTDALSDTLRLYPHAAGRLFRCGEEWKIVLSNSVVPVETAEVESASVGIDDGPWVLQRHLRQFFAARETIAQTLPDAEEESRLLLFKITVATDETAIGVSWHHTLGDATVLERFMQCLSERYQGHDVACLPAPTFSKRSFCFPTRSLVDQYSPLMAYLTIICPTSELGQRYASMNGDTSWVSFKISRNQLRQLKEHAMVAVEDASTVLSAQDVLTAYIVNVLNRYLETPIVHITNAASYRNVPTVVHSPSVAGNAIYIIPTTLAPPSRSFLDTALAIRQTMSCCRTPAFVEEYMAVASSLMLSAVNSDRSWLFTAAPGKLSVNSNASVFRSNPIRAGDHVHEENAANDSLDVFFAIARDLRDIVAEAIELELQAPNFPYNIDITSRGGLDST